MKQEFTFQYVSIISWERARNGSFPVEIYIPICFYYFLYSVNEEWLRNGFTFQYVSIISEEEKRIAFGWDGFTFQYVSIISVYKRKCKVSDCFIYIPICFYYFCSSSENCISVNLFTFQYVSIISTRSTCVADLMKYLHSNMFLLFRSRRGK